MNRAMILLVEDEPNLAQLMIDYLHKGDMLVHHIGQGAAVVGWVRENAPDLILLDLGLPGRDGLDICRDLRSFSDVPIIIMTARIDEEDRLSGLGLGADDYICKPFSPREVIARISAVLRRRPGRAPEKKGLVLDHALYAASYRGKICELTVLEFQLLECLMKVPGRIFTRDELMDRVYADHRIVNDRTIDSHVKKLRRKLEDIMPEGQSIQSVYGLGYKFKYQGG